MFHYHSTFHRDTNDEFYRLVNDTSRIPHLNSIPRFEPSRDERFEKNHPRKFQSQKIKLVQPSNHELHKKYRPTATLPPESHLLTSKSGISATLFADELKNQIRSVPVQGLLPEWERNILKLIPRDDIKKHSHVIHTLLKEVKRNYAIEIKKLEITMIVHPTRLESCYKTIPVCEERKTLAKKDCTLAFSKHRESLINKYFFGHNLIRSIVAIMYDNLSKNIFNIEEYRQLGEVHIIEIEKLMHRDLKKCTVTIKKYCYGEIVKCLQQIRVRKYSSKKLSRLLRCAENLFIQPILRSMINGIKDLVGLLQDRSRFPKIKLELSCRNGELKLEPSLDEIYVTYHGIVDGVANVAKNLIPLEEYLNIKNTKEFIDISPPEWFLKEAHEKIQEILEDNFKEVAKHYEITKARFNLLCAPNTASDIATSISGDEAFEKYCNQAEIFNQYLTDVRAMVANIHFTVGILSQIPASEALARYTLVIINTFVTELVKEHKAFNSSICGEFEALEQKALSIPDNSKDLFELSEYITEASKSILPELRGRIQKSIYMMTSLLQITILSTEHIELNSRTIKCLQMIEPAFSQHNILCEAKKCELEDELQKRINVLNLKVNEIFAELLILNNMDDMTRIDEYLEFLSVIVRKVEQLDNQVSWINMEERLFKFPETAFPNVEEIKNVLIPFYSLMRRIFQWRRDNAVWLDGAFEHLDATIVQEKTAKYFSEFTESYKTFKVKIKSDVTSNKPFKFTGIADDPDPMQQPAPVTLSWQALQDVIAFQKFVPLAVCMCNPALEKRHWIEMSAVAGIDLLPNAGTTLRKVIAFDLTKDFEKYEIISIGANKELALQQQLVAMKSEWTSINFSLTRDNNLNVPVFTELENIEVLLDEHFVKLEQIRASYFAKSVESRTIELLEMLCRIRNTVHLWTDIQKQCKYFRPFFSSEIINNQRKQLAALYSSVMINLNTIEEDLSREPTLLTMVKTPGILDTLCQANKQIIKIKEGVRCFLQEVRYSFTRLFFLSNNEILTLLFDIENHAKLELYVQKCFSDNIAHLVLDENVNVKSVVGNNGEELCLKNKISLLHNQPSITDWLRRIENEIKQLLRKFILNSESHLIELSEQWIFNTPGVAVLCLWQIIWTSQIQNSFEEPKAKLLLAYRSKQSANKSKMLDFFRCNSSRKNRQVLSALIALQIHQEDITEMLIGENVNNETAFEWKAQLRYYLNKNQNVVVSSIHASLNYAFEYYTCNQPLFINSPLTDRCHRVIMEAFYRNYFGATIGPSGTGKTETIGSLAKAIAVPYYVFIGEKALDYNQIEKILKGLASCGAWVCLKNFNRIRDGILSVITQCLYRIIQCKAMKLNSINFNGIALNFNTNCNLCVTMNSEARDVYTLPDSLKIHFRSVALVKPDVEIICQIELFASGFSNAKDVTRRLVLFYKLCSQLIFRARNDDFNIYSLRSLKTVLATVSALKSKYPSDQEDTLLIRALIDVNVSQLSDKDIVILQGIIQDVFPENIVPTPRYDQLLQVMEEACRTRQLILHDAFKLKLIQIYEMIHLKHSIVIIGDSFSGKTTTLKAISDIFSIINNLQVSVEIINPRATTIDRLFGSMNSEFGEWKEGIFSNIFRHAIENNNLHHKWIVFDGSLDSLWVDSLQSTLDQNKTLFLASGERLKMTKDMRLFFETKDLRNTSPCNACRFGIIYVDSGDFDWKHYLLSEISKDKQRQGFEKYVYALFEWSIVSCLQFLRGHSMNVVQSDKHLVASTFSLFTMYVQNAIETNLVEKDKDSKNYTGYWIQAALIMATTWILAGSLNNDSKKKFEVFYLSLWNGINNASRPEQIKQFEITLPSEGQLFDNYYVFKGVGSWKSFCDSIKHIKLDETYHFNKFIPTIDTIKLSTLFRLHVKYRKPFILCGNSSVGKTSCIKNLLNVNSGETNIVNEYSFNLSTDAIEAQGLFLMNLQKRKNSIYGPPKDKFLINFVDDLHLAVQGDSRPSISELLRQYMDYEFWYDINEPIKCFIRNVMFVAASTNNENNNNNSLSRSRCLRHFIVYDMCQPSQDTIFRIFSSLLSVNLKKNMFTMDVLSSTNAMINASIEVYLAAVQELRPTPSKLQYRFNLQDIQRIVQGCGLIQKESVDTKITFIRLWVHEVFRVFGDRIIDTDDSQWLFENIRSAVKRNFKDAFESVFDHLPKYANGELTKESFRHLIFANIMEANTNKRKYEEVTSIEMWKKKISIYLEEMNEKGTKKMDLSMTTFALEHMVRICRILAIPGGSMLMICSSGSGRKVLSRLAAFIQRQFIFEPLIDQQYTKGSWRKDLKTVLINCGTLRKHCAFLMTDRQMEKEFLHDISSLLKTGKIPNLLSTDEQRQIVEQVRLFAQQGDRNLEMSIQSVTNYFIDQCKQKLHFILCLSPVKKILHEYLLANPDLMDCCTTNWFTAWPEKALEDIAICNMANINIEESIKSQVISACKSMYARVVEFAKKYTEETRRSCHVNESTYVRWMKLYAEMIKRKQLEITTSRKRYLTGLEKLQLATSEVAQIKNTLTVLRPQLQMSAQQTEATMKEIENENAVVENATVVVKREEVIANKKAEIAAALRMECEADLAVAIPILEDAVAALNTLKPTDITLVKAMKNPPDVVKLVMAAVCVMLNIPAEKIIDPVTGKKSNDFWGPSKRVLGDMNFLQNLKDYDKDSIAPNIMQIITKTYMTDKSFMPHIVAKASSAAEGLCKWVRAMVSYDEVATVVAPKKEKLAAAQKECDEMEAFLNEKRKTLEALNAKLAALKNNLQTTLLKKLELENEVNNCTKKLVKAEALITSLGGERIRWMNTSNNLEKLLDNLAGDALLSSAIVSFLAPFCSSAREKLVRDLKHTIENSKIPCSGDYDFVQFLGSDIKVNVWHLCGLSKNSFSLQNAIIMENSLQWCLFVDPQNQANEWIKNMESRNNLQVVKITDENCMEVISDNAELGNPVLLENIGKELTIFIDSVINRCVFQNFQTWDMEQRQDNIVYRRCFRFYITTRHHNPQFIPDVFNKLTVTDFLLPSESLQDRLLDIVISREKPELQEKFEKILVQGFHNKRMLKEQEDKILQTLMTSSTNILEDENAIKILDLSKNLTEELTMRQGVAKATKNEIQEFRRTYNQFTQYCSHLYSSLNILPNINHMYRFSLSWFTQLYTRSIGMSSRSVIHEKRVDYLKLAFFQNLHHSIRNSLFERHKLVYSFILCVKALLDIGVISEDEMDVFLSLNEISDQKNKCQFQKTLPNPASSWLSDMSWTQICAISNRLICFQELATSFCQSLGMWQLYYTSTEFGNLSMPPPWNDKLTAFQKLIVVRIVCPNRVIFDITEFITTIMGKLYDSSPESNVARSYEESSCLTPLLFILPCYMSPVAIVTRFAEIKGFASKLTALYMGPGQEQKATLLIEKARKDGEWVFLHNCHFVKSWMPELEKICESFNAANTSLDFRVWMTTQPADHFSISVIQSSIKIAYDSPYDVKQTMSSTYSSPPIVDRDFFNGCPGNDKIFSKFLYQCCLFHATIRERKNFGFQSWNLAYDFDETDLKMSIIQLQHLINEYDDVPLKALCYFLEECNYGGKIMDERDKTCLSSIISDYFNIGVISSPNDAIAPLPEYSIPKRTEYHDCLKHIKNIPINTPPEVFGLDENAGIVRNYNRSIEFLTSLSLVNESNMQSNVEEKEKRIRILIADILRQVPSIIGDVQKRYSYSYSEPLNTVLIYEVECYNKLLDTIITSLNILDCAYSGNMYWSTSLEEMSEQLFQNRVPSLWKLHSYSPEKLLSRFLINFEERTKLINTWVTNGHPRSYCFRALASCKMLLCGMKLKYARTNSVSIQETSFSHEVLTTLDPLSDEMIPKNSFQVYDLQLLGARWDKEEMQLRESWTKIIWTTMPVISFNFDLKEQYKQQPNVFQCPLYVSSSQRISSSFSKELFANFVELIGLKSDVDPKVWIKHGTSMYCKTEE